MADRSASDFIGFLKGVEGFSGEVYDDDGSPAVGYGHRVRKGEDFSSGVSEEQAEHLMRKDINQAIGSARRAVPEISEGRDFGGLDRMSQLKLVERFYNLGPRAHREFPKWSRAVVDGDVDTELAEHQRFSNGLAMTRRNQAYEDFFHGSGRDAASRETNNQGSQESATRSTAEGGGNAEGAGASPPSALEDVFADPAFQALSPEQRVERLADQFPDFEKLHNLDPERARAFAERGSSRAELEDPDFWTSIAGGFRVGAGAGAWTMANAAMLIEELGIENDYDESWRKFAELQFLDGGNMIGSDWYDIVGSVVAGLPGGIAIPGLATAAFAYGLPAAGVSAGTSAALAPVLGFGVSGAVSAADEGPVEAAKRGFTDAALGAIYPMTAHMNRMTRMAIESGAAYAVNEQDDETRRGIESLAMGVIAGAPGRRAPFQVMQRLGVKDPAAVSKLAAREAKLAQEANAQTAAGLEMPLADQHGNRIENLGDAMRTYGEMVRNEHPMTSRPMDRPAWEREAIASRQQDSSTEQRGIAHDVVQDRKSARFAPGPEWVDHRAFTVSEENAPRIIKNYKKAGEVIAPHAKAFEIPMHAGLGQGGRKGVRGWYTYSQKTPEGKIVNPRRLQVRDRQNVQTYAHEWGHDAAYTHEPLRKLHDYRLKEVRDDFERIDEIASAHNVGPEVTAGEGGQPDKRFTGIVNNNGKATVSGIFKLAEEGKIPEDLRYIPELLSVSYDRDNLGEGIAEMFRLWTTNNRKFGGEVDLSMKFPNVMKVLEEWRDSLPKAKKKAFEKFQKDAHEHLDANGAAAIGAVMGADMDASGVLSSKATLWRQKYFDDQAGILNLVQKTYGRQVPDSVYETFRNLRGVAEMSQRMVEWGVPTFVKDKNGGRMIRYKGRGLRDILTPVARNSSQLDRFMRYATARQALELKMQYVDKNGRVRELKDLPSAAQNELISGNRTREKRISNEMIADSMKLAKDHPEYQTVFRDLQTFANRMADFGQEAGLWNSSQRGNWKRTQFVFSFFRDMEARGQTGVRSASILTGETPTRTLQGSTRNLRDPFQNLLETHTRTAKLALENIAKQELVRFIKNAEGGGRFGEILRPIPDMRELRMTDIREAAKAELRKQYPGIDKLGILDMVMEKNFPETGDLEKITMFLGNMKPHGENVMTVFVGGKPKYFDIQDPALVQSIAAMRRPQLVGVEKHWNKLRRFKQHMITIGPGFIAANFARDVAMASIMSKTGNVHLGKAMKGLWGAIRKDQDYQDYIANGGGASGIRETPEQTRRKLIAHAQRTGFDPRRLVLDAANVVGMLDNIGRTIEVASRLGEFKAARAQGARAQHAAYLGREVATDFAMRGDARAMNFLGNVVPFFNAMVAGGDRLYRGLRYDPSHKQATAMKIATVGMGSMALYMLNRQNPEYMDLPEWDRWGYWHFFVPSYDAEGNREHYEDGRFKGQMKSTHFKMPKLWEVGAIGTMGERVLETMFDGDDDTVDLAQDMAHIIGQNFGLNLFDRGFPLPVPVGADVAVEQFSNRILYTGNPIESAAMSNMEAWRRSRPSSPKVFSEYGELMRTVPGADVVASPARAEALLRGIFGEFAMIGAHTADSMFFPGGPSQRLDQRPVVSRFYEGTGKYSKQEQEFYERLESFKQAQGTMRSLASDPGSIDTMQDWISDPKKQTALALASQFNRLQREISALTENQNLIRSGTLPLKPAEARKRIDAITQHKRQLMELLNSIAEETERRR